MIFHNFLRIASWLSLCSTYVSAVHRMAQYPPFEEQVGLVDRQGLECPQADETLCPAGDACCPTGAACYTINGVPLCNEPCPIIAVTCAVNSILACCSVGEECSPSGCLSGGTSPSPTITGPTVATTQRPSPQTTLTFPSAASTSPGCGTDNPCYQGISAWCCKPSEICDFSSPGYCRASSTSSQTIVTTSQTPSTTSVTSLSTSHAAATTLAIATGLAAPNVLAEDILMKIWTCFAAMGVALGF